MKIEEFFQLLNNNLKEYDYVVDFKEEGLVYIGLPKFDLHKLANNVRLDFVEYLAMFVAFDLLVYSYDKVNYSLIKKQLSLPKFEYGLTYTFYYPDAIVKKLLNNERINLDNTFNSFYSYLCSELGVLYVDTILNYVLTDNDFNNQFGSVFKLHIINSQKR